MFYYIYVLDAYVPISVNQISIIAAFTSPLSESRGTTDVPGSIPPLALHTYKRWDIEPWRGISKGKTFLDRIHSLGVINVYKIHNVFSMEG